MNHMDSYRAYLKDRRSSLTQKHYINTVERYLLYLKGAEPSESNTEEFLAFLSLKGCKARSLNRHLAALKSFFKHVLRKELTIESYRFDRKLPDWLDEEEQKRYMAACQTPFEKALATTFLKSGIRVSEAANLKVDNIDPDGYLKVMGKGGKERVIRVKPEVIDTINEYLMTRKVHSNLVFPRGVRVIEKIIREIGVRAKINKKVTPHVLRHSMGSLWMDKGGDLVQLQHELGHDNISTTSIYTHTKPSKIKVPI